MSAAEPLTSKSPRSRWRLLTFYGVSVAATVVLFFAIRGVGEKLPPPVGATPAAAVAAKPAPPTVPSAAAKPIEALPRILAALAAVIVVGRLLGVVLGWIGQPPVIGEVVAGILLGPSLLGWVCRDWFAMPQSPLLPPEVAPFLGIIAQLGVILYMFLVGVDFNTELLRKQVHAATAISHASILAPFLLGSALALFLFGRLAPEGANFTSFALFMGVAMAVTAFPVLARILTDRNMSRTELGVLALSCAAVDDVTAWCLLALVAGVVQSQISGALSVIGLSLLYIGAMLFVVRPIAGWLIQRVDGNGLRPTAISVLFGALLLSALATEWIGIHAVFGAFLLGVTIPHDSQIAKSLSTGLEQMVTVLLLPAFFAYTGMRTQIGLISGWENWLICGLIIAVASLGKFGGTLAAARFAGLDWRTGSALGILMNTRGLMELIVLNIGLDLGVISPALFAMMVIMALVTTMATAPLLALLEPNAADKPATAAATP